MNIGIILSVTNSNRCFKKNIAPMGVKERCATDIAIDILKYSNVIDKIILIGDEYTYLSVIAARNGVHWHVAPPEWASYSIDEAVEHTIAINHLNGLDIEIVTVLYGTSVFWRPSWIRTAHRLIKHGRVKNHCRINLVKSHVGGCYVYRANERYSPTTPPRIVTMEHQLHLDINVPHDLELAQQIMECIIDGHISYPLDENTHETPEFMERLEKEGISLP